MKIGKSLSLVFFLLFFMSNSFGAETCPKGEKRLRIDEVCIPQNLFNYLYCLEQSGGGKVEVVRKNSDERNNALEIQLSGKGSGVILMGEAGGGIKRSDASKATKELQEKLSPDLARNCRTMAEAATRPAGSKVLPEKSVGAVEPRETPKLTGVAYVSFGVTNGPNPTGSLLLLVIASNPSEIPVVPIDYDVSVNIEGRWVSLSLERHTTLEQGVRVENSEKSLQPLMPGDWTGCFSGKSYLLGPGKLNVPVARDKPMIGTIRAFSNGLGLQDLFARKGLVVTVHALDGKSYSINEKIDARPESIRQQLIVAGNWSEGMRDCLR